MASLKEKIGYGFGDMSSSMFWKVFIAYLPFFYANVYGLSLKATAMLMLVTRIWDAVSDPMMGIIADRTSTRWGKYRPYLLFMAVPFAVGGVLLFTTPAESIKTAWAFATYILMMTLYTAINVPYGSMLGVMTDDSDEKTVFSSFRMFFAYGGSFIVLACWEPICKFFNNMQGLDAAANDSHSWQYAMIVVATVCCLLFLLTFSLTRERIKTVSKASVGADLQSLLRNAPWWILLGAVLCFNFFGAVRYSAIPFFFASVVGSDATLSLSGWSIAFYAGIFLSVGEVANMAGVAMTTPITRLIGKKSTFLYCLVALVVTSVMFFYIPCNASGFWWMMVMQILINVLTGIISPLVWSMYADISDYAELKFHTAATGLIFSSSSMAQKFGGAIGGSGAMMILAAVGYNTAEGAVQTAGAVEGIKYLMSFVPAGIALVSLVFIVIYPLTTKRMGEVVGQLNERRRQEGVL